MFCFFFVLMFENDDVVRTSIKVDGILSLGGGKSRHPLLSVMV